MIYCTTVLKLEDVDLIANQVLIRMLCFIVFVYLYYLGKTNHLHVYGPLQNSRDNDLCSSFKTNSVQSMCGKYLQFLIFCYKCGDLLPQLGCYDQNE